MNVAAKQGVLVIAYGNPLRSDDGVALRAAELLSRQLLSSAKYLCVHQLTPELAQDVSEAEMVLFMDAEQTDDRGQSRCERVVPRREQLTFSHHLTPGDLLGLTEALYAVSPRAFLVTIPGENFNYGETLSAGASQALLRIAAVVKESMQIL